MRVCDLCKNQIAVTKCDVCSADMCKYHGKLWVVKLGAGIMAKVSLCNTCLSSVEQSRSMEENIEFKKMILEFIKKQMVIDKLKDEQ